MKRNASLSTGTPRPDAKRIEARIAHLATLTDPAQPPYTRRAFTEAHQAGRHWLREQMEQAGLSVSVDAGGNLVGRLEGEDAQAAPIAMGSHSDTVVGGGRFDGIAGVIAALEVAQAIHEHGLRPRRPLLVLDFLSEEPSDYGPSCIGSRAIAGTLSAEMLAATNPQGETLREAIARVGGRPEVIERGPIHGPQPFAAFCELHIEQGPRLEREGLPIGVVSGVVGIRRARLRVQGQADHAGTTPMPLRRDALVGAAELVTLAHGRARETHERNGLVATVGRLHVFPNASNVVPEAVELILEARCTAMDAVAAFMDGVIRDGRALLEQRGLRLEDTLIGDAAPSPFSPVVRGAIQAAAQARGHATLEMQSGAGHDAMHIAPLCPAGMVFIPSRGGRSHTSDEYSTTAEVAAGTEVLLEAVLTLERTLP